MPIFGNASLFDKLVEKATDEANVTEDWQQILECCDFINGQQSRPLDCLRSILKRMLHHHPNVSIQAVILLDACVSNCGKKFHLEVASREFETEARKLLAKGHPKVIEKFKFGLRKWSENEFKSDPQLSFMVALVSNLRSEGVEFPSLEPPKVYLPKDPNIVISDQEEEDIIKALEASMKDMNAVKPSYVTPSTSKSSNSSLYPDIVKTTSTSNKQTTPSTSKQSQQPSSSNQKFKVRALYDFEAVEDNELTFKAGDIIFVTDNRDENWWSGHTSSQEGMFPANFVTRDLDAPIEYISTGRSDHSDEKKVRFLEEVTQIDEKKMDRLLLLLHEADPTGMTPDSDVLLMLEDQCGKMGRLIESELEKSDKIQVSLNSANRQLTEAMKLYLSMNS